MNSGSHMFIANGKKDNPITHMIEKKKFTHFFPKVSSLDAKKKWIIGIKPGHPESAAQQSWP